jgi:hypothetical protein
MSDDVIKRRKVRYFANKPLAIIAAINSAITAAVSPCVCARWGGGVGGGQNGRRFNVLIDVHTEIFILFYACLLEFPLLN